MLQTKHINVNHRLGSRLGSKLGFLVLLGLFTSIGLGTINSRPTHALTCDENSMVSCIDITFGDIVGSTDLQAPSSTSTSHGIDRAYFYLPVSLTVVKANDYNIKVYSQNGGELRSKDGDIIPTLSGEAGKGTSLTDLGKNGSVWGYRYNLSDSASDQTRNYLKVPSISDPEANIVPKEKITAENGTIAKVLTLGFATAVDGNLPAGEYSDKIVVAITATPKQTSAFGLISTMQEMTPEICASATTPRVDAALPDSTGIHHGDDRYVPETTLIDTRDNKSYLIRKLADGNCWMGQNLSLNLSTEKPLTNIDTNLISKSSWQPENTTQANTGVVWEKDDGAARSISVGWDQYWAGGNSFTADGSEAQGGEVGYAQRGNYYNWFAATAGSGKLTDIDSTTDGDRVIDGAVQDSICPKGWTLPAGGNSSVGITDGSVKSFYNLAQFYTGVTGFIPDVTIDTLYAFPMNFSPTGFYDHQSGEISQVGIRQTYWTNSSSTNVDYAYLLNYDSGKIWPGVASVLKVHGLSIRCVAR